MLKAVEDRLLYFMKDNKIDSKDLFLYSRQNPDSAKGILNIFDGKTVQDKILLNALQDILGSHVPGQILSANTNSERDDYLRVLYEFCKNPAFYAMALNWFSYSNAKVTNVNKQNKIISFSAPYVLGLAASSEKERVMNIGKPRVIEGYGIFSITGREVNSKKMTNFHFVFDNPDKKITVEIKYKAKNMEDFVSFILKSSDLKKGKTELRKRVELDYEKEFDVEVTIFTEE